MEIEIFAFLIIYLLLTNWVRILASAGKVSSLFHRKRRLNKLTNTELIEKYKEKFGIEFDIRIVESNRIHAAMLGIPPMPLMIISSTAIKELSDDELDWIICHEAGHCVKWHVLQNAFFEMTLGFVGVVIVKQLALNEFSAFLLAIVLGLVFYQFERYFSEYKADLYALNNVDSLKSMISANERMRDQWAKNSVRNNKIFTFLLTGHLSYEDRINMAKREMNKG